MTEFAFGVDVGRRGGTTAFAIVKRRVRVKPTIAEAFRTYDGMLEPGQWLDYNEAHERDEWNRKQVQLMIGADEHVASIIDWEEPRYVLSYLERYQSGTPHSAIVDALVQLHDTPPIKDNVAAYFAVNAVGQAFVDEFKHRCFRQNIWCNPKAFSVGTDVGFAEGDSLTPGTIGVNELLSQVELLMGAGRVDLKLSNSKHLPALQRAIDRQETAREHYMEDMRPSAEAYDLLYALALAILGAKTMIGQLWWIG